ncbi:sulfur oxidation c-type cytochrome SoxX [Flaviflagellibacter deserti]|uniref:Sulfur oxidation c-type cytochrome SoxX n=1 Tax=Flaviflagellibacter deserti TaxID=2267266 RepID=A0ABV9Z4G6_9HYPH
MKTLVLAAMLGVTPAAAQNGPVPYAVSGDTIPVSLTGRPGDPANGLRLIMDRHRSLCVLCHMGPFPEPHLQGNLAPDLTGVGSRLSEAQIRLRVVDAKALNPASLMPSYLKTTDNPGTAPAWRGKTILDPAEIEDIVAYLVTLKD